MTQKTLGERIKENRKRLGLTQDELARRMGVSAQAVSKWENNLSCPDISILPELAEIFEISLDELLGREGHKGSTAVHEAEPVEDEQKKREIHLSWDISKKKRESVIFAIFVLIFGGLLLMNHLLELDVSWWTLLWTLGLSFIGICGMSDEFSFFCLIMTLAGGFFLIDAYGVFQFDLSWGIFIPAVVIVWGLCLLLDIVRGKHKKQKKNVYGDHTLEHEYSCNDGMLKCELGFGECRVPVVTPLLRGGSVESSFGSFHVDFSGCEAVADGCRIQAENSFGSLTLLVPDQYEVVCVSHNSMAAPAEIKGEPQPNPAGRIELEVDNTAGNVVVKYISI